ncbi:MAG: tRNA (guanosine(46)-N7)-methyltransferase TrmB [Bacteroidetes bacterium]|nr:tRNA (guanosine(46)-N7)-methyltransferase TrmB [Bacteroidota bacterium]MBL0053886.1 tRNA (guanosine(46)-N7)-methyltransferase TrmB [Bacteroidota bacterium]
MGKDKLRRWAELLTMERVFQPDEKIITEEFRIKGNWHADVFKNNNPIVLELGCGKGEYTVNLAQHFGNKNFIGIDIKGARLWRGAKTINENKIMNAAFLRTRVEFIEQCFAENEVSEIWITFPDPQPGNAREHKRLTHSSFIERYFKFLSSTGIIHLKTDDLPFFEYSVESLSKYKGVFIELTKDLYNDITDNEILNIKTFYEKRWLAEGKKINYLQFQFQR